MKKVLISFVLLLSCIAAHAVAYTATSISCSVNNAPWSDWAKMSCPVILDGDNSQLRIYSDVDYYVATNTYSVNYSRTQVLTTMSHTEDSGVNNQGVHYREWCVTCLDKNSTKCYCTFLLYDDGDIMLLVSYGDIRYKYMLKQL